MTGYASFFDPVHPVKFEAPAYCAPKEREADGGSGVRQIPEVALGKIAMITMGTSPKGETYNTEGIGIPLLNGPTEFGLIHQSCTLFTTDSKKECKKGDLIFCVRGSTTGRMNWADRPYSLWRGVCSIRGETLIDTKFIRYCIENNLDALLKLSGGATFPNLTGNDLGTFSIPYPPYRHKIVAILSAYDDLIENNTRRIKILEEMAQALYREWFVKFRFPGHEKVRMVESELGMVPEGWEVKRLGDVVELAYGKALKADDRVEGSSPVYGSGGVVGYHNECLVKGPGIIVGRKGNVGSVYWSDYDFFPIDTVYYVKSTIPLPYIYYNLQSQNFINNGAAVPGLNRNQAYMLPFLLPKEEVLLKFENFVKNVFEHTKNLRNKITISAAPATCCCRSSFQARWTWKSWI